MCVCVCVCMCICVQCISLDQLQYCGVVCQLAEKRLIRASSAPVWLYSPVGAPQLATVYTPGTRPNTYQQAGLELSPLSLLLVSHQATGVGSIVYW